MKKINRFYLFIFVIFALLLTGCSFLFDNGSSDLSNSPSNQISESIQEIDSFEFVTDDKMIYETSSSSNYYNLILNAGESYQVKTTIDDKLKNEYYLKYKTDEDILGKFTLSETGYIQTSEHNEKRDVFIIDVELYKKSNSKKVASEYFVFSLIGNEYATIELTSPNLSYDKANRTYYLTLDSGNSFYISYSIKYNTSYVISFSLRDESYSSFMSVDNTGYVTTLKTSEDKVGEIIIRSIGQNGILDEVYLKINLNKSDVIENKLEVIIKQNGSSVNNGDRINVYEGEEISFEVKYNNSSKTNVIEVSDITLIEVNNANNSIKAIKEGVVDVIFKYDSIQVKLTVVIIKDKAISLSSINEGSDFIIVNGQLHFLNKMYVTYESGKIVEITDSSEVVVTIFNKDEKYKAVSFEYEGLLVSYDVKYYVTNEYEGQNSAYDINDYYKNTIYGSAHTLENHGKIKLLAIPVWFNDSTVFFKESQKEQIIEDIEYTLNGNRSDDELKSVKQYYEMQSYGAIEIDTTVSGFYNSSTSYKDYSDIIESKTKNSDILAADAIEWYFETNLDAKFEDYDTNNDGFIDGLILLYGANYYGAKEDQNRSIAYESTNYGNTLYPYNSMAFCPIGGLYGLSKKEPTSQLMASDLSNFYSKDFRDSSRIIIHEVGHMFGNVDLYESQLASERYTPAGGFVMQDNNFGGHDPYHVNLIGWSKPQIYASSDYNLGDKITIHLSDFQSTGQNIILTNSFNEANSLFDEYLILELFAPTGLNKYDSRFVLLNGGIRLWHVNSLLVDYSNYGDTTSEIIDGNQYKLAYSNNQVESEYDLVHLIRNNPDEPYNSTSFVPNENILFEKGDSFDMETFKSQFVNQGTLDNKEKLGWTFTVEEIYKKEDGTYGAIITLERVDNTKTEFSESVALNRYGLNVDETQEDFSNEIFGEEGKFTLIYNYVTPPSYYTQGYPVSEDGMCLFASSDGNGGYIELSINEIDGKEVNINSITLSFSKLTKASPTVLVNGDEVVGQIVTLENSDLYGYTYEVNSNKVIIQNQYNGTIDYWSLLALYDLTINYTIK